MPIRFRCRHCHQLMGIARRKAGTEVQCPTCRQNVVVPGEDEVPSVVAPQADPSARPGEPAAAPLFERSDFDDVLRHSEGSSRVIRPIPKNGSGVRHRHDAAQSVGAPPSQPSLPPGTVPPNGIFLSSGRATILAVVGIVLLALAFGAGLLVGRYL
jgi:phage FluMu protein Com